MVVLHPTRTGDKKIVAESVIYINYFLFPTADPLNDEPHDISIAKPFRFIKEYSLSVCRPARKVPRSERSVKQRIGEVWDCWRCPSASMTYMVFGAIPLTRMNREKAICVPSYQSGEAEGASAPPLVKSMTASVASFYDEHLPFSTAGTRKGDLCAIWRPARIRIDDVVMGEALWVCAICVHDKHLR